MSRDYRAGDTYYRMFSVSSSTGAAANADATPTATLYVNGVANGATVTVTNPATGLYAASATLPGAAGNAVDLAVSATVGGVATKDIVDSIRLVAFDSTNAASLGLTNFDAAVSTRLATAGYTAPTAVPTDGTLTVTLKSGTHTGAVVPTVTAVTNPVTAGTVSDKSGYSLAAAQAFNNTGTWTGSLSGSVGSVAGAVASVAAPVAVGTVNAGAVTTASFAAGATLPRVTLVDTTTNLTNAGTATLPSTAPAGWITAATFAAGAIDAAAIATDAITSAKLAADCIGASEVSTAAVTKMQNGLSTYAGGPVASVTGSVGSVTAGVTLAAVTHTGAVIPTVTTLTGHTPQTGDAFARIGATGSGLTSLAPASTALSTATWTNAKAAFLDAAVSSAGGGGGNTPEELAAGLLAALNEIGATVTDPVASVPAVLVASQPNYAPAKAGDAMSLTTGERAAVWASSTRTLTAAGFALDVNPVTLAADGLDAVIVEAAAGGKAAINARQSLALTQNAAVAGVVTGATGGAATILVKNPGGTVTRATLVVDEDGNRTVSSLNPPA